VGFALIEIEILLLVCPDLRVVCKRKEAAIENFSVGGGRLGIGGDTRIIRN